MGSYHSILDDDKNNSFPILIVSSDNRSENYIQVHIDNLKKYCNKHNYNFEFHQNDTKIFRDQRYREFPVYWLKLAYLDHYLNNFSYDYVMWIDTDAVIVNNDVKLEQLITSVPKGKDHIIIGKDYLTSTRNAGVFLVKNSIVGRNFVKQCIEELIRDCGYQISGAWAGDCYEQGRMNKLLNDEYKNYHTVINSNIISNTMICRDTEFVLHKYGGKSDIIDCWASKKL